MSFLAAIASGLLMWLTISPGASGLAVGMIFWPLLAVLWPGPRAGALPPAWWRPTRAAGALLHGYLAGATCFLLQLKWLRHVTLPGMVMLALYLALYTAVWALFAATVGRPRRWDSNVELLRALGLTAAAWTGLEWLRGMAFTGFGWNGLGLAWLGQNRSRPVEQWAEWIGVTGLSLFVILWSGGLFLGWRVLERRRLLAPSGRATHQLLWWVLGLVAAVIAVTGVGYWRLRSVKAALDGAPTLCIALVQPNVAQENKNDYESFESIARTLTRLTREAVDSAPPPDMVVWPESALPAPFSDAAVHEVLSEIGGFGNFVHVLGIDDQTIDAYYNSVAAFRGDPQSALLHHKVHLVPFGEYLPARGLFGRFDYIRAQLPGDFLPGDSTDPLPFPSSPLAGGGGDQKKNRLADLSLIPLVCFEDTLGRVARRFARPEPQILVNVTNDGWFLDSEGPDQHLANARGRTIELRRPMVRAANTGVTAVIAPDGSVTSRLPRLQEGVLDATVKVPATRHLTLYARIGDMLSLTLLLLAAAGAVHALWKGLAGRRGSPRTRGA